MQPGELYTFRAGDGIAYFLAKGGWVDYVAGIGVPPDSLLGVTIAALAPTSANPWDSLINAPTDFTIHIDEQFSSTMGPLVNAGPPHPESFVGGKNLHDPAIMKWCWLVWELDFIPLDVAEGYVRDAAREISQYARSLLTTNA